MKSLTLNRLRNTNFDKIYRKLVTGQTITRIEYKKLLTLAIIFINDQDEDIVKLGYRIIVFYSNQTEDYKPLYDVAINKGLYPIVKMIERIESIKSKIEESFFYLFQSSFGENYKYNEVYLSEQQNDLINFFEEEKNNSLSVVAPTSYGKSELIISAIKQRKEGNICVIVPTKALVAQTKSRIIQANIPKINKVITHPEMYHHTDTNMVAVLTQERLLRLLRRNTNLKFDTVFIDEAHNLLENDERSVLLASSITILESRNQNINFKFLSPFLIDSTNLSIRYTNYDLESFKINEYMKTEKLYIYNGRRNKQLKLYDQFLNKFFLMNECDFVDDFDFIMKKSMKKNIIYLNKPADLEEFSSGLSSRLSKIDSDKIKKACENISELIDPDYMLIDCIERGIVYHHGSVPENIKIYIEHLFSEIDEMRYIVTTSTLLEGVNIPAYTIFLLDNKKGRRNLSPAQFKNLIGRISRFSEIFAPDKGSLKYLEPAVYLMSSKYTAKNANLEKFIIDSMKVDKKESDKPSNVLLKNVEITSENKKQKSKADEFIENFEPGIIDDYNKSYAQTKIGKICYANNINEIDILKHEQEMQSIVNKNKDLVISNTKNIFDTFSELFIPFLRETEENLSRFVYPETRNFYKMVLDWKIKNASYKEMIASFLRYWNRLVEEGKDTDVYVDRWGDKTKNNGFLKLWTDIKLKTHQERVNLAIVRIKEEQDFLDNTFIKYIEVMNDLKLLDTTLYNRIKYGTNDKSKITLIKNGLSPTLVNLLTDGYPQYIEINNNTDVVEINPNIVSEMEENEENEILIFETKFNLRA